MSRTHEPSTEKKIVIVSDGTGETASQMIKAAMVQFGARPVSLTRFKNVRERSQIEFICEEAAKHRYLVVYTLVSPRLRAYFRKKSKEAGITSVDLLGPMLIGLAKYFNYKPKLIAGLLRDVDENYFRRISAMEYTIQHDDGKDLTGLEKADLVILGISRTSKTPLSMYLSHQGWKVANIPMIHGYDVPEPVRALDPRRIVCLTINPDQLTAIRQSRLGRLGQKEGGNYAEPGKVVQEIEWANEIFSRNRKWKVFDVTGKALEETASEIIRLLSARGLAPPDLTDNTPPNQSKK